MAFSNPILGGGGNLIRQAIKSPDFLAGLAGWRIAKDGSAEFNDVTVRGRLEMGPDGANIDRNQAYSSLNGGVVDGTAWEGPDPLGTGQRAVIAMYDDSASSGIFWNSYVDIFGDTVEIEGRAGVFLVGNVDTSDDLDVGGNVDIIGGLDVGQIATFIAGSGEEVTIRQRNAGRPALSFDHGGNNEIFTDDVRTILFNLNAWVEYMTDGGTEIGRWNRTDGYLELARIESGGLTIYSGWANAAVTDFLGTYYKDANGFVHIEGRIARTSAVTSPSGDSIANLPEGFRPARRVSLVGRTNSGGQQPVAINVDTSGDIRHFNMTGSGIAQGFYVTFSGQFYVGH